jgi:nucleoside-diphosphate-sugar epimerase
MIAGNYRKFMEVHILRIFFMFGSGQRREMFLPALIDRIARGESVRLNGRNGIRINPVHAKDAATAVRVLALLGGPKTVNIAGEQILTMREIADEIGRHLNVKPSFERFGKAKDLVADRKVLSRMTGPDQHNILSSIKDLVTECERPFKTQ